MSEETDAPGRGERGFARSGATGFMISGRQRNAYVLYQPIYIPLLSSDIL